MCGLAGCFGDLRGKDPDIFRDLLYVAGLRGTHSSGLAAVDTSGNFEIAKAVAAPSDFLQYKSADKLINLGKIALIGHARHATIGHISHENAHPFGYIDVVGAHNGTLRDWRKHLGDNATDSRALIEGLSLNDPKDIFGGITGAWAVTWFEQEGRKFRMLRNSERTLFYAEVDSGRVIFYASEAFMLHLCLTRHGMVRDKDYKVYALNPDVMLTWTLAANGRPTQLDNECIEGKKESQWDYTEWMNGYNHRRYGGTHGGASGTTKKDSADESGSNSGSSKDSLNIDVQVGKKDTTNVVPLLPGLPKTGPTSSLGKRIARGTREEVTKLALKPFSFCVICGAETDFDNVRDVIISSTECLCRNCDSDTVERALVRLAAAENRLEKYEKGVNK